MSDKIQSDKRCPVCGYFIKISEFGVHTCSSCPFRCFGEDFPRIATAMDFTRAARDGHNRYLRYELQPSQPLLEEWARAKAVFDDAHSAMMQAWREE